MDYMPPYLWEIGIAENNVAIRDIAERQGVPLVPFAEADFRKGHDAYGARMYADSIHMSPEGNQFKANIFADSIAPIIAEKLGVPVPPVSEFSAASMPADQVVEVDVAVEQL
jgi:hypothetical protein